MPSMESNNKKFYTVIWLGAQRLSVQQDKKLKEGDAIKHVLYFDDDDDDRDKCFKCLQLISSENVLLVISDMSNNKIVLDEKIFSQVHSLYQVKNIYVDAKYCNCYPSQRFPKVRDIRQNISPIFTFLILIDEIRIHPNSISLYRSRFTCAYSSYRTVCI